jgi:hypothetical protein
MVGGRPKDSVKILNEIFEVKKRVLGVEHPSTLADMDSPAGALSLLYVPGPAMESGAIGLMTKTTSVMDISGG